MVIMKPHMINQDQYKDNECLTFIKSWITKRSPFHTITHRELPSGITQE